MTNHFESLGLRQELQQAITESGYDTPTPIQLQAIPALLEGFDVLGQAQTGTGKTAAFTLPMLEMLDYDQHGVQVLILTPTRELASQVSTNIFRYGKYLDVRVLPIYGGTSYDRQLRRLERGIHVVVGTPGRLLDLIRRGALNLSSVRYVVLDEADEMLKMGFVDDVESILSNIPLEQRQTALFSATLSDGVRSLAERYMRNPKPITIAREKLAVPLTEQRYYVVHADSKMAALTRLLETEDIQSALVFTRTRAGSSELSEVLSNRGYTVDALHGDLNQAAREAVLRRFRSGQLPILVATDVVARGVDISGVSHVFNFDMPYDPEDYVHRIGRTGRAGRSGIAITLLTPQETRRLRPLEDYTSQKIARVELPDVDAVLERRKQQFIATFNQTMESGEFDPEFQIVEQLLEAGSDPVQVAAAAIRMARAGELKRPIEQVKPVTTLRRGEARRGNDSYRNDRGDRNSSNGRGGNNRRNEIRTGRETGMVRLKLDKGHNQGIRPRDIVGAIAAEAGIPGKAIGAIDIQQEFTFVDVKALHVEQVLKQMRQWRIRGKSIKLTRAESA